MNNSRRRKLALSTTPRIHGSTIMQTSTTTSISSKTGTSLRRKARILVAEIFYALALSNRAYYQGINRF
jgi:hypothetical protein